MKVKLFFKQFLLFANLLLFGTGSFLCFVIAVVESKDRFLISGIFLLLFAFVNNKLIKILIEKL